MIDLFGFDVIQSVPVSKNESRYQKFKRIYNYRKADTEKKCKNCEFARGYKYHGKTYYKCSLIGISQSEATDILINNVCDKYEKEGEQK